MATHLRAVRIYGKNLIAAIKALFGAQQGGSGCAVNDLFAVEAEEPVHFVWHGCGVKFGPAKSQPLVRMQVVSARFLQAHGV